MMVSETVCLVVTESSLAVICLTYLLNLHHPTLPNFIAIHVPSNFADFEVDIRYNWHNTCRLN